MYQVKDELRHVRNGSPCLSLLWNEMLLARSRRELWRYSHVEALKRLHYARSGRSPNLEALARFIEKQRR